MNAAFSRSVINPQFPCKMEGYHDKRFVLFQKNENGEDIDPMRTAWGVRDDLYLDTVLIEEGGTNVVFHVLDVVIVEQIFVDKAIAALTAATGLPAEAFVLAASHTHASPLVSTGIAEDLEPSQEYLSFLIEKMVENTKYCMANKKPSEISFDRHPVADGFFCSRKGQEFYYNNVVDDLRIADTEGHEITRFLTIGCHPSVLDNKNMFVSNDLLGVMKRYIQAETGVQVAISNAEGGDVSTRMTKKAGDWPETIRIGEGIAKEILSKSNPVKAEVSGITITEVPYEIDYVPAEETYLTEKKAELEGSLKTLDPESKEAMMIERCFLVDVNEKLDLDRIQYRMSSFIYEFGSFRVVTFPAEIDTELAKQLRDASDIPVFLISYANGFYYYAVNREEYGINHESFNSRFSYGQADEFIERIISCYK